MAHDPTPRPDIDPPAAAGQFPLAQPPAIGRANRRHQLDSRFGTMADYAPVMLRMSGADGRCGFVNAGWLRFTGRTLEQELGEGWTEDIHPDDLGQFAEVYSAAFDARQPFRMEYRLRRADGAYRWVVDAGAPYECADGGFAGYISSCTDITERREAETERDRLLGQLRREEEQQRRLTDDLRRASAARDEFIGLVSHELRTPIGTILGNAEVLAKRGDQLDPASRQQALLDILSESERLRRVVENMLALARSGGGRAIEAEPTRIDLVLRRAVDDLRRREPGREVRVRTGRHVAQAEGSAIEEVLNNLLSNASKYSPAGSPIDVSAERQGDRIVLSVSDRGPGLDEEELPRVFTPFFRGRKHAAGIAGMGIGLTVCKRLVEAQAGEIEIRNREGGGAEVRVSLPRSPA